jgi:hypothetical protein
MLVMPLRPLAMASIRARRSGGVTAVSGVNFGAVVVGASADALTSLAFAPLVLAVARGG